MWPTPPTHDPSPARFQGERDEFTSPSVLRKYARRACGVADVCVAAGLGHFELEHPAYDGAVATLVAGWAAERLGGEGDGAAPCERDEAGELRFPSA